MNIHLPTRIRVLIVDDSAFARKVIREVLSADPEIEVIGHARDGLEAIEKIADLKPDVVTLDLVMPDLDGLGVLKALPKDTVSKIIVVSVSGSQSELAIEALHNGAFDLVTKPTALPTDRLYQMSDELIRKVKAAAVASAKALREIIALDGGSDGTGTDTGDSNNSSLINPKSLGLITASTLRTKLVVIGTSTGGPQALTYLFKHLPVLPVPIAIALHIPAGYTVPLAARLSRTEGYPVVEAEDGMELEAGRAVIAPGGKHLRVIRRNEKFFAMVQSQPYNSLYHPSVDLLFESAAESAEAGALGVILTGMGNDGMVGSESIRKAGGRILAESSSSCIVYGMPRSVIEAGFASAQAPLSGMSNLIVHHIMN